MGLALSLERIWAGWRFGYITASEEPNPALETTEGTLFERILNSGMSDEECFIVHRGQYASVLLNAYPYTSGHVMVLPNRAVAELEELSSDEHEELWRFVTQATVTIKATYQPHGVNVGINMGHGAGAGVPDHLHVHVLPRWHGDTNFMTSIADARVLPEPLGETWHRLRTAWPN